MYDKEHYSLYNQAEGLLEHLISLYSKIIHEEKQKPQPDQALIARWTQERSDLEDDADRLRINNPEQSIAVIQRYSQHPNAPRARDKAHDA